ncbi:MAG: hypothetical protein KAY24_17360 [Candidatus Eisenbacteria sp.]|nr:hypothetical protein [Candidatus Eisenbacteria bacterium]
MSSRIDIQQWKQAQELYHAARELRVTDREQFLEYHCKGDPETRILVQQLLESTDGASFLSDVFDDSR